MKATRIVIPASAAVAAIILTACADKPVRIPGGSFVEEPYTGETTSRNQTIPSNGENTLETEIIYTEDDVPVGPVEDNRTGLQGGEAVQGSDSAGLQGGTLQPVEQQPTAKSNVPEGSVEYKVVKGDTLWGIGMVYGVSVARLAEINGISEKSTLRVGQVLMIPPDAKNAVGKPVQKKTETKPATTTKTDSGTKTTTATTTTAKPVAKDGETLYVVKSGDNLSMIAYRHHVKLADLIAANKVDPKAVLRVGQTLVIPAAGATKAATATTTTKTTTTTTTKTDSGTKTTTATTTKPATATTKTEPATTTTPAATTTQPKAGEGSGGIVEPIGGGSMGGSASSASTATTKPATASGSAISGLEPVSGLSDADVFAVPIDAEYTFEEVAEIHDKKVEDLIRLNPEFKPGQKIPAGTAVKMPLF